MPTESRGKTETDATLIREVDEHELDHVCAGGGGGVKGGAGIDPDAAMAVIRKIGG